MVITMSRIGKQPIKIPENVLVELKEGAVVVSGPKGKLTREFRREVEFVIEERKILVERKGDSPKAKSLHGLSRTLLENMIFGVAKGWNKGLEIVGTGYRASVSGNILTLNLGFSHPITLTAPEGIGFEVKENRLVNVFGANKELVGETAAKIRRFRPPEPYKGKGIRYIGEKVRRKAGKAAAKTAAVK